MSIQSNQTGLRIAEEATPKVLPGTPIWEPFEPNSYDDFGGEVKTVARTPIVADRQRKKGTLTDLDASAGFQLDFTNRSLVPVMQGFMFADWRKKADLLATATTGTAYTVAANGTLFVAGDLVFAENFGTAGNNGLKKASASTGTSVTVGGLTAEASPPSDAHITKVGFEFAAADLALTVSGGLATLAATVKDLTQLGLVPGEWFWVGGDAVGTQYATTGSNGLYRAKTIAAGSIVCDRYPDAAATDVGTGKTIRLFLGNCIKNEADSALQVLRTYQAERTLSATQVEYVLGACPNTLKVDTKTADKLTATLAFVGLDSATETAQKAGTRPSIKPQEAFSSSSDFMRLRLLDDSDGSSLAVYLTDMSLSIDNGVEADKAIGTLGGVDFSIGDFMVSGSVEAYFSTTAAIDAVRNNTTVALDFGLAANVYTPGVGYQAAGWVIDVPAIQLGDGKLKVEKDKKVKLPVNLEAVASAAFNHTLLAVHFPYLPQLAL